MNKVLAELAAILAEESDGTLPMIRVKGKTLDMTEDTPEARKLCASYVIERVRGAAK